MEEIRSEILLKSHQIVNNTLDEILSHGDVEVILLEKQSVISYRSHTISALRALIKDFRVEVPSATHTPKPVVSLLDVLTEEDE